MDVFWIFSGIGVMVFGSLAGVALLVIALRSAK
jgi:hypothetical protein